MIQHLNSSRNKPARVIVLGGSGFVGKALVTHLEVHGIPAVSIASANMDLIKPESTQQLQGLLRPDDALAFCSALTPDKGKDSRALMKNLTMAQHVSEALQKAKCAHVIYVSSDAVYEESPNPIRESTCPAPASLYAIMHLTREKMLASVLDKSGVPLLILRPCAIYGAGDTHNSYGPNRFIRAAKKDGKISLFGMGEEKRHHLYVDDFIGVITECLVRRSQGLMNVAGIEAIPFGAVAKKISDLCDPPARLESLPRQTPITHRHFDLSNLMRAFPALRWRTLELGLAEAFSRT